MPQGTLDISAYEGKAVYAHDGSKVGEVEAVFLDKDTQEPEWLSLRRGRITGTSVLVPLRTARVRSDAVLLPYSEEQISGAPAAEGEEVGQETERALAAHFGLAYSEERSETGLPESPLRSSRRSPARSGEPRRTSDGEPTRDELYAEARRLGIEGRSKLNKRELARAVERHRGRSGAAGRRGGGKANPIEVQRFLEGVGYPTRKADLVREAEQQGAGEEVRSTLERIRDEKFDSPADVSEAIGRLS